MQNIKKISHMPYTAASIYQKLISPTRPPKYKLITGTETYLECIIIEIFVMALMKIVRTTNSPMVKQ